MPDGFGLPPLLETVSRIKTAPDLIQELSKPFTPHQQIALVLAGLSDDLLTAAVPHTRAEAQTWKQKRATELPFASPPTSGASTSQPSLFRPAAASHRAAGGLTHLLRKSGLAHRVGDKDRHKHGMVSAPIERARLHALHGLAGHVVLRRGLERVRVVPDIDEMTAVSLRLKAMVCPFAKPASAS